MSKTIRVVSQRVTLHTPRAHTVYEVADTPRIRALLDAGILTDPDALPDAPPPPPPVEPSRADLIAEAEGLDIQVGSSWSKARIREAIAEAVQLVEGDFPLVRDDDGPSTGGDIPGDTDGEG